jgi:hypothetical protein
MRVLALVMLLASAGCHTIDYDWKPDRPLRPDAAELGGIEVDIVTIKF